MTIQIRNADISRRGFMIGAAGFTFAVASELPVGPAIAAGKDVVVTPWVTISTDDTVAVMSPAAEMGQGSLTSLPLILAEELDADWSKVHIVVAPPNDELYKNPAFGFRHAMSRPGAILDAQRPRGIMAIGAFSRAERDLRVHGGGKIGTPVLPGEPSPIEGERSGVAMQAGDEDGERIALFAVHFTGKFRREQRQIAFLRILSRFRTLRAGRVKARTWLHAHQKVDHVSFGFAHGLLS